MADLREQQRRERWDLHSTCAQALKKAYAVVRELGDKGREEIEADSASEINMGRKVLIADLEAEKAVIETLRQAGIPVRIIS